MTALALEHALFRRYPLAGHASTSAGRLPTPYQVYDGTGLLLGGFADLAAAQGLLAGEQVQPVATTGGRALMAAWVCDFTQASLGPHHELQLSLFVARGAVAPVPDHPLALLEAMITRPEIGMLCHGLWNSTREVVAYNRDVLALDARLSESRIERTGGALRFGVRAAADAAALVEGALHEVARPAWGANLALLARVGPRRLMALAREPWIRMPVLCPVAGGLGRNAAAESFTKAERSSLRRFDPARDRFEVHEPRYRSLCFEPQFFQLMEGFKFVYLAPR